MQCPRVDTVEEGHFESRFKDVLVCMCEGIPGLSDGREEKRWGAGGWWRLLDMT